MEEIQKRYVEVVHQNDDWVGTVEPFEGRWKATISNRHYDGFESRVWQTRAEAVTMVRSRFGLTHQREPEEGPQPPEAAERKNFSAPPGRVWEAETTEFWTEEDLARVCGEWQKVLRLQDWRVVIRFKRGRDMNERTNGGTCWVCCYYKEAVIDILDPLDHADFDQIGEFPLDVEQTIVHELLEIHFDQFKKGKGYKHTMQEQTINLLSSALTKLKRFR